MSIDKLQEKIRKWKNPSAVELNPDIDVIPDTIVEEEGGFIPAYIRYCGELLDALTDVVPAVRFSFNSFSLLGSEGFALLQKVSALAKDKGYYVLLDAPVSYTEKEAAQAAQLLLSDDAPIACDGVVVCPYIGADSIKPYADRIKESGKDVFAVLRTGNKTAAQLQDLLTGSRLVHVAAADIVSRLGQNHIGRKNYSSIACVSSAVSGDSLRTLRSKYKNLFILVEGYDYSNANAKNCSYAFDAMGHGALVCAGSTVTAAWKDENAQEDYLAAAVEAARRMKKNLLRYITVL